MKCTLFVAAVATLAAAQNITAPPAPSSPCPEYVDPFGAYDPTPCVEPPRPTPSTHAPTHVVTPSATPALTPAVTPKPTTKDPGYPTKCHSEANVAYAGFDLTSTSQAKAESCCADCDATEGCRVWTWTNYNGGTCWLKHTVGPKSKLPGAVSAVNDNAPGMCGHAQVNKDFYGNDIGSAAAAYPALCCDLCESTDGCSAFTWTGFNDGTCWLKSEAGYAVRYQGAVAVAL
ncbi:Aste57867_2205 [Aphanomyces stellatus]|uniref:Aste57867_2205 protein n=1 Tax=Aphanomyces stellatus TaxID=120398 RepID=A0A485KC75_9STRA|nr:hypothetical protein As57867_002200 [Aphanomyces stellatus]VFT79408.1 Aste57867_2205 [Aphanomyces stellatus]